MCATEPKAVIQAAEIKRVIALAKNAIGILDLDLKGTTVLTEVGSKYFLFSPIIAAMGGAYKVVAYTRDSRFGLADDIVSGAQAILDAELPHLSVEFVQGELKPEHLHAADIITNSGFLRPLDAEKLRHCRPSCVVPLMYEKWELRADDIDIDHCTARGIKVAGTWEDDPRIQVFQYVGALAIKMAFEAGYEVFGSRIIIWSDDDFGKVAAQHFKAAGAAHVVMTTSFDEVVAHAAKADFIFFCDYSESRSYNDPTFWNWERIQAVNSHMGFVHLYGALDAEALATRGFHVYPLQKGGYQTMTRTLAHVGPRPFVNLYTAGLKVGQMMLDGAQGPLMQPVNF